MREGSPEEMEKALEAGSPAALFTSPGRFSRQLLARALSLVRLPSPKELCTWTKPYEQAWPQTGAAEEAEAAGDAELAAVLSRHEPSEAAWRDLWSYALQLKQVPSVGLRPFLDLFTMKTIGRMSWASSPSLHSARPVGTWWGSFGRKPSRSSRPASQRALLCVCIFACKGFFTCTNVMAPSSSF